MMRRATTSSSRSPRTTASTSCLKRQTSCSNRSARRLRIKRRPMAARTRARQRWRRMRRATRTCLRGRSATSSLCTPKTRWLRRSRRCSSVRAAKAGSFARTRLPVCSGWCRSTTTTSTAFWPMRWASARRFRPSRSWLTCTRRKAIKGLTSSSRQRRCCPTGSASLPSGSMIAWMWLFTRVSPTSASTCATSAWPTARSTSSSPTTTSSSVTRAS
mmetsp:Transcript_10985/g.36072  ORF Transcript_10985/g.36072 Transcript_10985/m.36072 type:complete len:216 (+) Transcript_10985:822-1469(+)